MSISGCSKRAIERALIDKDVVISDLEKIHNTDSLSEMADLLIRLEHVNWALCFGEFNGWVHFSLRTGERQGHAGQIAKKIVAGIGAGGGHHVIAGGKVRQNSEMANAYQETTQLLKSRFFAEINRVDFRASRSRAGREVSFTLNSGTPFPELMPELLALAFISRMAFCSFRS